MSQKYETILNHRAAINCSIYTLPVTTEKNPPSRVALNLPFTKRYQSLPEAEGLF